MATETLLHGSALRTAAKPWLEELGKSDRGRLEALIDLSQADKIRLSDALTKLFPDDDTQAALANLTRLRNRLNDAGKGLSLRFEADTKKKSPPAERAVWFTGPDAAIRHLIHMAQEAAAEVAVQARSETKAGEVRESGMASYLENGVAPAAILDALEALRAWTAQPEGTQVLALLGEVGMGKTILLKRLVRSLVERHTQDARQALLPVFLDLHDYCGGTTDEAPPVEEVLLAGLRRYKGGAAGMLSPAELLGLVQKERVLLIFDGLDGLLVRLPRNRGRDLLRALGALGAPGRSASAGAKVIVSFRSHSCRDAWSQQGLLKAAGGDGAPPALSLLPWDVQHARACLSAKLGRRAASRICADVRWWDLITRPLLLGLICDHFKRAASRPSGDFELYSGMVRSWLDRDDARHVLSPAHKGRLMEELAAAFRRSGSWRWEVDQLEEWLDECLLRHPAMASVYASKERALLKADLLAATFLVRPDIRSNDVSFAHAALQEYFLAANLLRALRDRADETWNLPPVTPATLDFLGQMLAAGEAGTPLQSLERILGSSCLPAALLAFHYWLRALEMGYPAPQPARVNLRGGNLEGMIIRGQHSLQPLKLCGADLRGVQLNRSRWEWVDLREADLTDATARQALFLEVDAGHARLRHVDLAGARWRKGSLDHAEVYGTDLSGAELIHVIGHAAVRGPVADHAHAEIFAGHSRAVSAAAWNPRRPVFATTSLDQTLRLWDAETATEIMVIRDAQGVGLGCDWSPDGSSLLSQGADGTLKTWDTTTGRAKLTVAFAMAPAADAIPCCWSPGAGQFLLSANGRSLMVWDARDGSRVHVLEEAQGREVRACAWSPDGRRVVCGYDDGSLALWNVLAGTQAPHFPGHGAAVACCAWSPDAACIAAGSVAGEVLLSRSTDGSVLHSFTERGVVSFVGWNHAGTRLLCWVEDRHSRLVVLNAKTWTVHGTRVFEDITITSCAWSADGQRVLLGTAAGGVVVLGGEDLSLMLEVQGTFLKEHPCYWDQLASNFPGTGGWTLHALPQNQSAILSADRKQILHATPEAWRWLGWEERDARGRFIRRLPAEVFGPIPGMED